jgi:hypothetical protein
MNGTNLRSQHLNSERQFPQAAKVFFDAMA